MCNENSFDFTMNWAKSVFDVSDTLLVMRPYQIAATERILWKVKNSYQAKSWSKPESGGYIWHTDLSAKRPWCGDHG